MNEQTLFVEAQRIGGLSVRPVNITAVFHVFMQGWRSMSLSLGNDNELMRLSARLSSAIREAEHPREQDVAVAGLVINLAGYVYSDEASRLARHPALRLIVACLSEMVGEAVPLDSYAEALDRVEQALGVNPDVYDPAPKSRPVEWR